MPVPISAAIIAPITSRWIIKRSEALAPKWEELADRLAFAPKNGFYLYDSPPASPKKRASAPPSSTATPGGAPIARLLDTLGHLFPVNKPGKLRNFLTTMFPLARQAAKTSPWRRAIRIRN